MVLNLVSAINASIQAGEAILEVYNKDFAIEYKTGEFPLTEADKAADLVIKNILGNSFPILSEEGKSISFEERKYWDTFWMVDPLDGTKEFVKKNGEFTVNIALIKNGLPILGVVYLPVASMLYFGAKEIGSYSCKIDNLNEVVDLDYLLKTGNQLGDNEFPPFYTIVASRSHLSKETEDFINKSKEIHGDVSLISKGSSIKLCLVAERKAHVYPRVAPTMEWDTAAAHAVAKFSGCKVLNYDTREELVYNKENLLNPSFIVIA
jgi:3'(2'), 5'-bisphosphate nucleotidase